MRLTKFFRLDKADRGLLVKSACLLAAMRVGLCVMPTGRLHALAVRWTRRPGTNAYGARPSIERIAWAVSVAARYVPGATCLPQALTAELMLVDSGHPARIRVGVARTENRALEGHAWVESDGAVVVGAGNLERYTVVPALDRNPGAAD